MKKEAVILLHGLGRSKFSLFRMANSLKADYQVVNLGYPSRRYSIETLAELAITPALELSRGASKVHFVTHSMGGILLRQYLSCHTIANLGNTVMLGPPNQGSELVDFFLKRPILGPLFSNINGPAGQQLGTTASAKPLSLGEVNFNLGVIAGTQSKNPVLASLMDGPNDGKVSVERSKIKGMTDHLVMPVDHTFMMQRHDVIAQVQHFLTHARFNRAPH